MKGPVFCDTPEGRRDSVIHRTILSKGTKKKAVLKLSKLRGASLGLTKAAVNKVLGA